MRHIAVVACLAALAACGGPVARDPSAPARSEPARSAPPTTRLVLVGAERDCADFIDQASAQAALRADPTDPHGLDADRDGIACEHLGPPRDEDPVAR